MNLQLASTLAVEWRCGERIEIVVGKENLEAAKEIIERVTHAHASVDHGIQKISVPVGDGSQSLIAVIREFDGAGIKGGYIQLLMPESLPTFRSSLSFR